VENIKLIKIGSLQLSHVKLKPSQIHKLRGYIGNLFKEHELIHNHNTETGKVIYRYPLIQFKLINNTPVIIAITETAIDVFTEIFLKLEKINIEGTILPVYEKDLKLESSEFGFMKNIIKYEFKSPWLALNQKNYRNYISVKTRKDKEDILKKAFIGNILSMSKYLDYWLEKNQKIEAELNVKPNTIRLKGENLIGFTGLFKTNFLIPDYVGIGKSISRGFGTVKRVK
jgi:hypothetical protein